MTTRPDEAAVPTSKPAEACACCSCDNCQCADCKCCKCSDCRCAS